MAELWDKGCQPRFNHHSWRKMVSSQQFFFLLIWLDLKFTAFKTGLACWSRLNKKKGDLRSWWLVFPAPLKKTCTCEIGNHLLDSFGGKKSEKPPLSFAWQSKSLKPPLGLLGWRDIQIGMPRKCELHGLENLEGYHFWKSFPENEILGDDVVLRGGILFFVSDYLTKFKHEETSWCFQPTHLTETYSGWKKSCTSRSVVPRAPHLTLVRENCPQNIQIIMYCQICPRWCRIFSINSMHQNTRSRWKIQKIRMNETHQSEIPKRLEPPTLEHQVTLP